MSGRVTSSTFIGRRDHLESLVQAYASVDESPAVVLVGGEAGVGKTRLVT